MPLPGVVQVSEAKKQAILADCIAGMSQKAAAAKHGVHPVSVNRWWNRFKKLQPIGTASVPTIESQKQALIEPAFSGIKAGLSCVKNAYRQAEIGISYLKGVGILSPDGPNLSLHFSQPPTSWSTAVSAITAASPAPQLPAPASDSASQASNSTRESHS